MSTSSPDEDIGPSKIEVSRVDVILNKINQIEVCKYVNDCAKTLNNDITADATQSKTPILS